MTNWKEQLDKQIRTRIKEGGIICVAFVPSELKDFIEKEIIADTKQKTAEQIIKDSKTMSSEELNNKWL